VSEHLIRYISRMTRELASSSAREVASYLKTTHGATRVLIFGSTVNGEFRIGHSDIDLYFEGIPHEREMVVTGMTFCDFPTLRLDLFPAGHATHALEMEAKSSGIAL
jgi:hypothetical protein